MTDRNLERAKERAQARGVTRWRSLRVSTRQGKRFSIETPSGRRVHFGVWPYARGTFLDHGDAKMRAAWRARHSQIVDGAGQLVWLDPESPAYYAYRVLWT